MGGDSLTRADCYVLPSLQHIRVAGKVRRSGLALPFLGCFAWLQCIDAAYGRYNVICVCVLATAVSHTTATTTTPT